MNTDEAPCPPRRREARSRKVLYALLGLAALGALVLTLLAEGRDIVRLQLAGGAADFVDQLLAWSRGGAGFGDLRWHLFIDSLLFVPGYVGMLVYFTLRLSAQGGTEGRALRHLWCVPAVAAGFFDIAENGLTGRAIEDYVNAVLADATVSDLVLASTLKWQCIAIAMGVLAIACLSAAQARPDPDATPAAQRLRRWELWVAAGLSAASFALLGYGAGGGHAGWLAWGAGSLAATLGLLCVERLHTPWLGHTHLPPAVGMGG